MSLTSALRCLTIESARKIVGGIAAVTDGDVAIMVMLAPMLVVLVGAMLTPVLRWAARQPLVPRVAAWVVRAGIRWSLWQVIKWLLFRLLE